ncbi:MAG: glycosyl transferase [Isosphaeraceae bacterium]|jgi:glycosyltransferase involved in cell wall biosynthesis|nr:MAG: glycosyl transferase [Isosphaeraceae bacterium]
MTSDSSSPLVIAHLLASPFFGGPERQILGLAEAMPSQGFRTVMASFAEAGAAGPFLAQARSRGFDARRLRWNARNPIRARAELRQWLRDVAASVLITHGYKPTILGTLAARQLPMPVVSVSRGWTAHTWKVRVNEALERRCLRFVDQVVCVSRKQADRVAASGVSPSRITVIRNAIDPARFAAADPTARRTVESWFPVPTRHLVAAVGRLSPEKGFGVLVDAATRLVRSHPDLGIVLIGAGPLRETLASQIRAAGLEGRFVLAGFRDDVDRLLLAFDALAIPSFTEGLPNVALEACAAGIPVVASRVGGVPEIIDDGLNGWLVPPGDPAALSDRLAMLFDNPRQARAMGSAGRERVQRDFSFEAQAEAYARLLDRIAPQGRSRRGLASHITRAQTAEASQP